MSEAHTIHRPPRCQAQITYKGPGRWRPCLGSASVCHWLSDLGKVAATSTALPTSPPCAPYSQPEDFPGAAGSAGELMPLDTASTKDRWECVDKQPAPHLEACGVPGFLKLPAAEAAVACAGTLCGNTSIASCPSPLPSPFSKQDFLGSPPISMNFT